MQVSHLVPRLPCRIGLVRVSSAVRRLRRGDAARPAAGRRATAGTGTAAAIPGIDVAGKTGTAEKENGNDSWFVGMAPAEDPRVVVAIVIEDGEEGVGTAKAQNVLKTALEVQGLL